VSYGSGGTTDFHLGAIAQEVWGRKSPMESRSKAPVGYLGDEVSQKLMQSADIDYRFGLQKRSECKKMCTIHLLILDHYVSRWGISDILGA